MIDTVLELITFALGERYGYDNVEVDYDTQEIRIDMGENLNGICVEVNYSGKGVYA